MSASSLSAFFIFCLISTFTPGPNNILALSSGSRHGLRGSIGILGGMSFGFFCVMAACGLLILSLSTLSDRFFIFLRYAGCAYIAWLAWHVATAGPAKPDKQPLKTSFLTGFFLQFLNIKIIIYGITAFSTFVLPFHASWASIIFFAALLSLIACASQVTWASVGALLQRFLSAHWRLANFVMGILLLGCAISMAA